MVDPLSSLYTHDQNYSPRFDGTFWLLTSGPDTGLALDETVYRVWQAFDGRQTAEAVANASTDAGVCQAFAESTAKVLARAGLLVSRESPSATSACPCSQNTIAGTLPLASVIILASRQARPHLETCLPSVVSQTYPALEVILVDNQTLDDSVAFTSLVYPQVKIVSTGQPLGFAAANNLAIRQARGEFVFLINEDIELASDCVAECVRVAVESSRTAVVAPKMRLFHMRGFLNSMGTSIYPDGRACDNFVGYLDAGQFDDTDQVFAACFGAALLRRAVIEELGGLDERYHFYYEDMDFAYGARLRGYDIVAAPQALAYHKFSATIGELGSTFKQGMAVRNRLLFAWKNLDLSRARRLTRMYRLEDRLNSVRAKHEGRDDVVREYRNSVLGWVASWPGLALARVRRRWSRYSPAADDAAFALTAGIPEPAMYGRYPIISASNVRDHYMNLECFRPESPWEPEGSVASVVQAPSLASKVTGTLRDSGLRGLAQEGRRYVRWLVDSW